MERVRFPPRFADGVRRFNTGEFFEAHEVFEDLLDEVEGDERWELRIALIQIAVGHQCAACYPGAARMLRLGETKLARFPAVTYGLAVQRLQKRAAETRRSSRRTRLHETGTRAAGRPDGCDAHARGPATGRPCGPAEPHLGGSCGRGMRARPPSPVRGAA